MANSFSTIEVSRAAGVLTVTLNRPRVLNAFNGEMSVELSAALRMAQRDDALRCVVLTGRGRGFCVGQDVRDLRPEAESSQDAEKPGLGDYVRDSLNPVVLRLRTMEKPVIAAINGVVAGAGVGLALAADLRLAARSAKFKLAFVNIGLVPDAGTTLTLVQHVGCARAAELCLLGEVMSAERAAETGLVSSVVEDEQLPAAAQEMARKLVALPTGAIGLTKRALRHAWTATLDEQLEYEALLQTTASRSAEHREGVAAFLEKRPPRFGEP